jgi:hypothetical protein
LNRRSPTPDGFDRTAAAQELGSLPHAYQTQFSLRTFVGEDFLRDKASTMFCKNQLYRGRRSRQTEAHDNGLAVLAAVAQRLLDDPKDCDLHQLGTSSDMNRAKTRKIGAKTHNLLFFSLRD